MRFRTRLAPLLAVLLWFGSAVSLAQDERLFRWSYQGDANSLDPHALMELMTLGFLGNVYEGLVGRDQDMSLVPLLATEWQQIEPKVWRFQLRYDVTFHNGNPFTADDVVFSIQRINSPESGIQDFSSIISRAVKVDEQTVDLHTTRVNPILPYQLETLYIMDREWAEQHDAQGVTQLAEQAQTHYAHLHANGTGPYQVLERRVGEKTVFQANANWWSSHKPQIQQAEFVPMADDEQRFQALLGGNIQLAYPIHMKYWRRLDVEPSVKALIDISARTIFLGFDQDRDTLIHGDVKDKNPFKDPRVRQAFQKAIDLQSLQRRVMRNQSQPTALMIGPKINGYAPELDQAVALDLPGALQLMADAGYAKGFSVTLDCPNDRYVNDEMICRVVAAMLSRIHVKVHVNARSKREFFSQITAHGGYNTSFYLLGWAPSTLDALHPLANLMACRKNRRGGFNVGGYCNPEVDQLIAKIESERDPYLRQNYIEQAMRLHQVDVGHIPLHQQPLAWGLDQAVSVWQRPDNVFKLQYARFLDAD